MVRAVHFYRKFVDVGGQTKSITELYGAIHAQLAGTMSAFADTPLVYVRHPSGVLDVAAVPAEVTVAGKPVRLYHEVRSSLLHGDHRQARLVEMVR